MTTIVRDKRSSIELSNCSDQPRQIIIEPWADELILHPKERWLIVCESPESEPLPIDFYDDSFVVFGLKQSIVRIFRNGEQIWESFPALE